MLEQTGELGSAWEAGPPPDEAEDVIERGAGGQVQPQDVKLGVGASKAATAREIPVLPRVASE